MHLPSEQKPTQDCLKVSKVEEEITMIVDHEIPSLARSCNMTRQIFCEELERLKKYVRKLIAKVQSNDPARTLARKCLMYINSMLHQKAERRNVQ